MNEGTETRRQRNGHVGGVGGLARVTPTYVGSRSEEIAAMLSEVETSHGHAGTYLPPPTAGTDRTEAVDARHVTAGQLRENPPFLRDDVDAVEHLRQNRLRSWQKPADKVTGRF